ncbi:hypothetical protein N0V88_006299 [Collariella sp. IMI 366227]|nr:hypothetical protein N0V88_006299 [Collariella sp. IMI 366227]
MAPTDKTIAKELAAVVRQIYNGPERDQLTVNYVRQAAEEKLKLDDGFLKEGSWKSKSKQIIVDTLSALEDADEEPLAEAAPTPKRKAKPAPKAQPAPKPRAATKKRGKKAATPSDIESEAEDAPEEEEEEEDAAERPAKKRKTAKRSTGRKKAVCDNEDGALSDLSNVESEEEPSKSAAKRRSNQPTESESSLSDVPDETSSKPISEKEESPKPVPNDDDSDMSSVIDEPPRRKAQPKAKTAAKTKASPPTTTVDDPANDSSSSLSSVLDDPPTPPKRKCGGKAAPTKESKTKTKPTTVKDSSPDEILIKTLQSQLSKCGVRKVWAFEFKRSGADTPKAKIKHLKQRLTELGMTGRFSEARAREIKEMRELQADLQDVVQGEKNWGIGREEGCGGRLRRVVGEGKKG